MRSMSVSFPVIAALSFVLFFGAAPGHAQTSEEKVPEVLPPGPQFGGREKLPDAGSDETDLFDSWYIENRDGKLVFYHIGPRLPSPANARLLAPLLLQLDPQTRRIVIPPAADGLQFPDGSVQTSAQNPGPRGFRGPRGQRPGPKGEDGDVGPPGFGLFCSAFHSEDPGTCCEGASIVQQRISVFENNCRVTVSDSANGTCSASQLMNKYSTCCACSAEAE